MEKTEVTKDKNIKLISMHDEMSSSYLSYAMSVIVSRALPDVRDGLKPVHRRILYAMYKGGYDWSKQFRKSARIVGDVIGKYHPHGDQSVYDALVRMVQDFSMSLPLVEGQGNFGSIDGDPAAAMIACAIQFVFPHALCQAAAHIEHVSLMTERASQITFCASTGCVL